MCSALPICNDWQFEKRIFAADWHLMDKWNKLKFSLQSKVKTIFPFFPTEMFLACLLCNKSSYRFGKKISISSKIVVGFLHFKLRRLNRPWPINSTKSNWTVLYNGIRFMTSDFYLSQLFWFKTCPNLPISYVLDN